MDDELMSFCGAVKENITIAILRAWRSREWKLARGRETAEEAMARLTSTTAHYGATPVTGSGGNKVDVALVEGITAKDLALEGEMHARKYFEQLLPKWERLTDDERYILTVRYIDWREYGDSVRRVCEHYNCSRSEAYRMTDRAIKSLSEMIFLNERGR